MAEHIVYDNGLKYTFHDDETFNAFHNGEAYFDESKTLRRKDNGQICKSVRVEADDRFGCDGNNDNYSNDETDISSSQNNDLPFPWNIIFKAIYFYSTNEEVRNTVNGLMNFVAPKAKDFFCSKIMPSLKKLPRKTKGKIIKLLNKTIEIPTPKVFKKTQKNTKLILVKKHQNLKQSKKNVNMSKNEVGQEMLNILMCLYAINASSEKLKNAGIDLDEKTLLEELNNPKVVKQFKQYMKNPKALPLTTVNEINLMSIPAKKEAIKVDSMGEKNR